MVTDNEDSQKLFFSRLSFNEAQNNIRNAVGAVEGESEAESFCIFFCRPGEKI